MPATPAPREIVAPASAAALEYHALLALVADEARTDLGAERLVALTPADDTETLVARRDRLEEVARLAIEAPFVPALGDGFAALLARLESAEPPLDGLEILRLAGLLAAAADARRRIQAAEPPAPGLVASLVGLDDPTPLVRRVQRLLDRKGEVRDDASPRLGQLRRQVASARERVYARLESLAFEHRDLVGEETVPLRGGRLMLMLQAGARGRLGGLVHGRSASGKSLYFEPLDVVEDNNSLQSASDELEAERRRILAELLAELAAAAPLVGGAARLVGELDAGEAMLRFARALDARLPELAPPGRLRLVAARHPLLDSRLADRRERVLGARGHEGEIVPLDLELGPERRVLVLTGPNAGGKTVALKTVGLLALAAQAGLPIPCAAGSELPCFASLVATVGDEQDLLAERSTFSGRLARLAEAYRGAGSGSLALLDELGSGTDPEEGTALSIALLEALLAGGGLALVTTHLTGLAAAAMERPGAACAAMEFEPSSGRPTFRLRPGSPGGSEAIALARRMALPEAWIARAEALLGGEHRELRRLLAELEATRQELAREAEVARREAEAAREATEGFERERAALESERRVVAARAKRELAEFRERVARELAGELARLKEEVAAGRRRDVAAKAAERLFADAPVFEESDEAGAPEDLAPGETVRHRRLGWSGRVERREGERVEVLVRGKRLRAPLADLVRTSGRPAREERRESAVERPRVEGVAPELQLIGERVEPALERLDAFLDDALLGGRGEIRVVHGHGTGKLREAVRAHLKRHPGVASFRPGAPNEGGNGATVVTLAG